MTTHSVYKNPYLNCGQLVIAAMLEREGVENDRVWKQAGLLYKETDSKMILTPYYREFLQDVEENSDIHISERLYPEAQFDEFMQDLVETITEKGATVGVAADVFELPHCIYYQKLHEYHLLEVVGYNDGIFDICDHYFHYQGQLTLEELKRASYSIYENTNNDSCKQLNLNKEVSNGGFGLRDVDVQKSASEYLQVMQGTPLNLFAQYEGATIGLEAITKLKEGVDRKLRAGDEEAAEACRTYFSGMKEVGNSRYHLYMLLKRYGWEEEASLFLQAYQYWTVVANLVARIYVVKTTSGMIERVANRFDQVFEQEKKMVEVIGVKCHTLNI